MVRGRIRLTTDFNNILSNISLIYAYYNWEVRMVTRSAFSERFAFFAGFGLALVAVAPETARADGLETLNPGVLQVAIEPYMPYTALKDGKLVGLDSDILAAVASKLGLKIETSMTDFPGMLAAVQSQRADITIGGIAWSDARRKVGLFTDPPYYSPPAMAVHGTPDYPDVASLEGMALGTVTGYVWAKSIAPSAESLAAHLPDRR
jgi:polar amino acid transport system substrate-binding protein